MVELVKVIAHGEFYGTIFRHQIVSGQIYYASVTLPNDYWYKVYLDPVGTRYCGRFNKSKFRTMSEHRE